MCESGTTENSCRNCQERLLSVREAARMLPIAEKSVRNRLSAGTFPIPSYKFGGKRAFKLSEILEFIDSM
jgi:predicted DNA-binding transcriptional regulator AlpA